MQKVKILGSLATIVLLLQGFSLFAQIKASVLDSILTASTAYGPNPPALNNYKFIAKPHYKFKYIPIRFTGMFSPESYSRYAYGIRFYDTANKKVYILQHGKNVESKRFKQYSGITFIVNDKEHFLPLDFKADDAISNLINSNVIVQLQVEAWLVYSVNDNRVLPFLLVKNVKNL